MLIGKEAKREKILCLTNSTVSKKLTEKVVKEKMFRVSQTFICPLEVYRETFKSWDRIEGLQKDSARRNRDALNGYTIRVYSLTNEEQHGVF